MEYAVLPATAIQGETPLRASRGSRILVVDDEPNIVRLIQVNLECHGYQVETANNGAQALARIRESRPDLLIADVMMPELDGFELLALLRRDPELNGLPVLMMTAKAATGGILRAYTTGTEAYIVKPFTPEALLGVVRLLAW